jgi:hypothetical protein
VTSDVLVATLAAVNGALSSFVYTPPVGFVGQARIIFEIDDQGNTGTGGVLSRTRFIDIFVGAATDTPTPTDTATLTPSNTPGGPTDTPTNTAVAASATPANALPPSATPTEDPCLNPQPSSGVQGRILETTFGYFEPSYASATNVTLQQGTSWWVVDAQRGFYELWIACRAQNVWVPAGVLGPNFDDV